LLNHGNSADSNLFAQRPDFVELANVAAKLGKNLGCCRVAELAGLGESEDAGGQLEDREEREEEAVFRPWILEEFFNDLSSSLGAIALHERRGIQVEDRHLPSCFPFFQYQLGQ